MTPQPNIVTRAGWGARTTIPSGRFVSPQSRRFFVVHYPVMSDRDEHLWCQAIEAEHRAQGWAAAPGYNYLVGMSGTIYEGCGRDVRGIHTPPHNTDGWGCCVLQPSTGTGVLTAPLSEAAKTSTRQLYDWLSEVAGHPLNKWYHGKDYATACPGGDLRNWVNAGMPAAAATPEQPPTQLEVDMMASGVGGNGALNVFMVGPQRKAVWLVNQPANSADWSGGEKGKQVAKFRRFRDAPSGRTIRGITCERSQSGVLSLFVTLDDGTTLDTWQKKGETTWNEGLRAFAPAP
jgi:hypothetical protein